MKKTILAILALIATLSAWAVPARRDPFPVVQPNGDTLMVRLVGDERWHAHYTEDGYLIKKGEDGYYYYAKWEAVKVEEQDETATARPHAVATSRVARNESERSRYEKRWLIRKRIPTR